MSTSNGDKPSTPEPFNKDTKLRFEDAVRFLFAKTSDGKCYACGTDKWEILTDEIDNNFCLLPRSSWRGPDGQARSLVLECLNCGLVRLHRTDKIFEWLSANPPSDGGKGSEGGEGGTSEQI